jgi:hypothetical protein
VLAELARDGLLNRSARVIFQPAEEIIPGGALDVVAAGETLGLEQVFAFHCEPRLEVGRVGLRVGPITAGADGIKITLTGPGGHTARPHLTADLIYALGSLVTELPGALSRLTDPRAGLSVVWGQIHAGTAANAIPSDWEAVDAGPETVAAFSKILLGAKTIIWNGPVGVFEIDATAKGTLAVAAALANATAAGATTVIGGGDSASAVKKAGVASKVSHVSTGGGASLEFLEGKVLPGVAALTNK